MHIALLNKTSKYRSQVTDEAIAEMASAYAHQLRYDVAPAWGLSPSSVIFYADEKLVPVGSHVIAFMDDSDQQGVLGWHTEDATGMYGRVFAGPSIENDGTVLQGAWSVAVTGSHEVLEMVGDPYCNLYAADGTGKLYSTELCDPVEGVCYYSGKSKVSLSNFILPSWTDTSPIAGEKFDHLGELKAPFTLLKGGYVVYMQGGQERQVFGAKYPEWKKAQLGSSDPLSRRVRKAKQLGAIAGTH